MPKVFNKHCNDAPPGAVYIGRGSRFGNGFVVGVDGDRDYCVDSFEQIVLPHLDVKDLRGKDLVCFCAPLGGTTGEQYGRGSRFRCHGYSILKKANS